MIYVTNIIGISAGLALESRPTAPACLMPRSRSVLCLLLVSPLLTLACQHHVALSRTESGGLGLNRSDWEEVHGPAVSDDSAYVRYRREGTEIFLNFTMYLPPHPGYRGLADLIRRDICQ